MNWATMARIDIIRKVLYGGKRIVDNAGSSTVPMSGNNGLTVLGRTITPRDAHSWAKVYAGGRRRLVRAGGIYQRQRDHNLQHQQRSRRNRRLHDGAGRQFPRCGQYGDVSNVQDEQSSVTTYDAAIKVEQLTDPSQGDLSRRRQSLRLDRRIGIQLRCLLRRQYPAPTNTYTYKPQGLLQRMAVNANGSAGTSDDTITMRFGLISGSYDKNFSGGVLRSKVDRSLRPGDQSPDRADSLGTSKVIKTIDMFRVIGYSFSTSYSAGSYRAGGCRHVPPRRYSCRRDVPQLGRALRRDVL